MAERLDASRAWVSAMVGRDDFPPPIDTLGRTPIWLWVDVQAWRETERKPGPRGSAARSDEWPAEPAVDQYSPLITKNEPRITPASLDFWRANLNRSTSSSGTSIPSDSLNPTARLPPSAISYITLITRPDR